MMKKKKINISLSIAIFLILSICILPISSFKNNSTTREVANKVLGADYYLEPLQSTVTVTFDANGGYVCPSKVSYNRNSNYGILPTPTRTGYRFLGWYYVGQPSCPPNMYCIQSLQKIKVTESSTTGDTGILTAEWEPNTYKIDFRETEYSGTYPYDKTVTVGQKYGDLPTPTKEGYKFKGWYTMITRGPNPVCCADIEQGACIQNAGLSHYPDLVTKDTIVSEYSSGVLFPKWEIDAKPVVVEDKTPKTALDLCTGLSNCKIKEKNGNEVSSSSTPAKTGQRIISEGKETVVVVMMDLNGDGGITSADQLLIKKHLLNSQRLVDEFFSAADINKDGKLSSADQLLIKKHLLSK